MAQDLEITPVDYQIELNDVAYLYDSPVQESQRRTNTVFRGAKLTVTAETDGWLRVTYQGAPLWLSRAVDFNRIGTAPNSRIAPPPIGSSIWNDLADLPPCETGSLQRPYLAVYYL